MPDELRKKYRLKVLLNPFYWMRIQPHNEVWDKFLEDSLDAGKIELVGSHEALINGRVVWISNFPYASGTTSFKVYSRPEFGCSRITALYLQDQLKEARIIQRLKGPHDDFQVFLQTGIRL